jgi:hypothetical protein
MVWKQFRKPWTVIYLQVIWQCKKTKCVNQDFLPVLANSETHCSESLHQNKGLCSLAVTGAMHEISGSHGSEDVIVGLLGCNTMWTRTKRKMLCPFSGLKMGTACFSEMLSFYKSTWHHNSEDQLWYVSAIDLMTLKTGIWYSISWVAYISVHVRRLCFII